MSKNPCTDILTDKEYLEHMIPHHQVAIDMSNLLIPYTQNPVVLNLCRNIITKQEIEILHMKMMLDNISDTLFTNGKGKVLNFNTMLDYYEPVMSKSKEGGCNPLFFDPDNHSKHMENMKITEESYLDHMIPHHQIAIDMSRRLLLHTNHSYLMQFCYNLIYEQQCEILYMNNLLKNKFKYCSNLL